MPLTAADDELSFEELVLKATAENNIELLRYSLDNIFRLDSLPAAKKQNAINKALYQASSSEITTVATIKYLIAYGADVKSIPDPVRNGSYSSLLKIIISQKPIADKIELINLWVENGENINRLDRGENILFYFASWKDETLRDFLLAKGADASFKNIHTNESVYINLIKDATIYNRIDLIDYAIGKISSEEKFSAFKMAIKTSFNYNKVTFATIKYLINICGDVSFISDTNGSILSAAVYKSRDTEDKIELVKFLLAKGIDINLLDQDGGNILFIGKVWENETLRDLLLNNGADLFIKNKYGDSILTSLYLRDVVTPSILLFMQNLGLDFDRTNHNGDTVLSRLIVIYNYDVANTKNIFSCIKLLLEAGALNIDSSLMDKVSSSRDKNLKKLFELTEFTKQIYRTEIKNTTTNTNFSDSDFPTEYHDFIFNRLTSLFIKLDVPKDFDKYVNDTLKHLSSEFKAALLFAYKTAYYVNKIYNLEEPGFNGLSLEEQQDKLTASEKDQIVKLLKEKITVEGIPTKGSYNEMFYNYISTGADDLTKFIAGDFVEEMHLELVNLVEVFLATYLHLVDNEHFPSPTPYSKLKARSSVDSAGEGVSVEIKANVIKTLHSYESKLNGSSIIKFFNSLISRNSFELVDTDEINVESYKHLNVLIKQINSNLLMPKQAQTHLQQIQKACNLLVIKYEVNVANEIEEANSSVVVDIDEHDEDDDNIAEVTLEAVVAHDHHAASGITGVVLADELTE